MPLKQKLFPIAILGGFAALAPLSVAQALSLPPAPDAGPNFHVTPVASVDEMPAEQARAFVVGIQEELAAHGYKPGTADGVMGSRTRSAIQAYQRDAGLPVNGVASSELLDHLKFVEPKVYARKEAAPADSTLVLQVQGALAVRGYYLGSLDGKTGPETRNAVKAFQTDAGLDPTGKIDQRLLQEIRLAPVDVNAAKSYTSTVPEPVSKDEGGLVIEELSSEGSASQPAIKQPESEEVPAAPAVPAPPE